MADRVTMSLADAVMLAIRSLEMGNPDNARGLLRDLHRQLTERDEHALTAEHRAIWAVMGSDTVMPHQIPDWLRPLVKRIKQAILQYHDNPHHG